MKCKTQFLIVALVLVLEAQLAGETEFPKTLAFEETDYLKANSSSVKAFGFIKLLSACLYVKEGHSVADYPDTIPLALRLRYERNFNRQQLINSADKVLSDLYSMEQLQKIEEQLNSINSTYVDVQKGDEYTLIYHPLRGTTLLFNGKEVVTIPGERFAEIYFSIWLGDHPDSQKLSKELLKQS
jgi:hypothetical protein